MSLCPGSVLITGANRGIGLEFVKQFLSLPSPPKFLFAACRSPDSAKELQTLAAKSSSVTIIKIDLLDLTTIAKSVQVVQNKLGDAGLNLLVNNAGIAKRDNIDSVTPDAMAEHYNVHVIGPLVTVQNYLPLLKKAGSSGPDLSVNKAAIVNISSGVASIGDNGSGNMYAYRCAKAAQNMLTKTLSVDLKGAGILCSAINPGWVQTDMGGPSARLTTEHSVTSMFKVIATFQSENQTGKFYNHSGDIFPW